MKITKYIDVEIENLKIKLFLLEDELNSLSQKKNDCLNKIDIFNIEYHKFLGSTMEKIFKLKIELAKEQLKKNKITEEELFIKKEEYYRFKGMLFDEEEEEEFLEKEEEKELKKLYRKASRLTHPDIVSDFFREEASEIFVSLNRAYKRKDLEKVKEILKKLENDIDFSLDIDNIDNKDFFIKKINIVKDKISILKSKISELKSSIPYRVIEGGELDEYLEMMQYKLNKAKNTIEEEIKEIKKK